jgi:hypothetical protein
MRTAAAADCSRCSSRCSGRQVELHQQPAVETDTTTGQSSPKNWLEACVMEAVLVELQWSCSGAAVDNCALDYPAIEAMHARLYLAAAAKYLYDDQ